MTWPEQKNAMFLSEITVHYIDYWCRDLDLADADKLELVSYLS